MMRPFRFLEPPVWTWLLLSLVNVAGAAELPVSPSLEGTRATTKIAPARTILAASGPIAIAPLVEPLPTNGRNIYRLASAELNGQADAREIVGSTYDDRVCAFESGGTHLWDATFGGFVFDLAAGDLDGDGAHELVFNSGVYSLTGGLRQTIEFPEPFKVPSYDQFPAPHPAHSGAVPPAPEAFHSAEQGRLVAPLARRSMNEANDL